MSLEFILTSLLVIVVPGPGAIYSLSMGLSGGGRAALAAALGCGLGVLPHLLASIFGLASLLHVSAVAFALVKYAGALYMLYMAWGIWHEKHLFGLQDVPHLELGAVVWRAVVLNLLNPKLSLFFVAFLPQFVGTEQTQPLLEMLLLGAVFMWLSFAVFALYGGLAHSLRSWLLRSKRVQILLQRGFSLGFVCLGFRLAQANLEA
jgi:threonine/homoserine/homoserine lactone efflux protein